MGRIFIRQVHQTIDSAFTRVQKALRVANLILALGLFCLAGELVALNLHMVIHKVIHYGDIMVCEQTHIHAGFPCDKDLVIFSFIGEESVDIVRERAGECCLITYPVFLPHKSPPPKTI